MSKKRSGWYLILLITCLLAPEELRSETTSRDYFQHCQRQPDLSDGKVIFNSGRCLGFVQGYVQTRKVMKAESQHYLERFLKSEKEKGNPYKTVKGIIASNLNLTLSFSATYCVPKGVTYDQMVRVWIKYMQAHPETLHEPAAHTLYYALKDTFACDFSGAIPKPK